MTGTVPFGEAFKVWARIAGLSFGGPAGQIAVMHRILVEEKRWLGERRFLHALSYCTLLPGPEAQQLAIYIGWLMNRTAGGLMAGALFVLPGFLAIMGLSIIYALFGSLGPVAALFFGLKAAVLVVVVQAVIRVGSRALKNSVMKGLAAAAFIGIYAFDIPFPLHLIVALVAGIAGGAIWGGIVGLLKARTGAHEVIVTIMLNYVAYYLIAYMLRTPGLLQAPGSSNPKSPATKTSAIFPELLGPSYNLTIGFILVIIATAYVWYLLNRSSLGFKFRAIGENPNAARVAGIDVKNMYVYAMLISGGLMGLAGANQVQASITTGFGSGIDAGIGFDAITVALLGRSKPWGVFVAGILFGAFKAGGFTMQASQGVPIEIVLVVQSLIVLFIAAPPLVRAVFRLPAPSVIPRIKQSKISGKKAVVTK